MTLRETDSQPNIVAARIITLNKKKVTVLTEEGQVLSIPLARQYRQDHSLFASLKDILKAQIWIPVNKKLKALFATDWLVAPKPTMAQANG